MVEDKTTGKHYYQVYLLKITGEGVLYDSSC